MNFPLAPNPKGDRAVAVLISIQSRYVRAILDGSKTIELRRKVPRNALGMPLIVYSSGEDRAVTAQAVIVGIASDTPQRIWEKYADALGITEATFMEYFDGASVAFALHLGSVTASQRPLPLHELRSDHGIEPPQSWRYLQKEPYTRLVDSVG
ncbi:hypothetical protein [Paenarthrobacter sp. PH39-S1]|uniref:hypothetical protein n=1 Tax=Paenarthrobacter sp. PH39-S1 TaxID=3046204 RepID=UPI0024B9502A|nr:hypothetical protein [Paenarthrobacter sp. PH39-S1]MDJ0356323.1 hypothetical protein [Paenarthrobacter sp. PH39-S1]